MFPPFPTDKARAYCQKILSDLENGNLQLVQVSAPSAERDGHGIMIGVLVCKDSKLRKIILKAVSGNSLVVRDAPLREQKLNDESKRIVHSQNEPLHPVDDFSHNKTMAHYAELWVPPIAEPVAIAEALLPNDKKIHELTDELKAATTDRDRRRISDERSALTTESLLRVHSLYKFHTIGGEILSLAQICRHKLPPTGTGDCCAPKLLDYAFAHGLKPVSMDEVFYQPPAQQSKPLSQQLQPAQPSQSSAQPSSPAQQKQAQVCHRAQSLSPQTQPKQAQKISGTSYPPCDERCGIVLPAMLGIEIVYRDDDIIVVNKQSGILSVPGRTADKSDCIVSRVRRLFPRCIAQPSVHRLDMETSGLMVLAFTAEAHRHLSMQFQNGDVQKKYTALLDGALTEATGAHAPRPEETHGSMTLYFRLDIDNRPNQIWDEVHGKKSITEWERLGFEWYRSADGTNRKVTRVLFKPHTGRTHQLRLASSDSHGFGIPIVGDTLYNEKYKHLQSDNYNYNPFDISKTSYSNTSERLCLHAHYLRFTHPTTNQPVEFTSHVPF